MSFIDDQMDDFMMQDALGLFDDDDTMPEYNDRGIMARKQAPDYPGGVDWRYEKGGAYYSE